MHNSKVMAYFNIILVNILWGTSFIASKYALVNGFSPLMLALMRFVIITIIMFPLVLKKEKRISFPKESFVLILASGLMGVTMYYVLAYNALELTSASNTALIFAAVPIFSMLYNAVFKKKKFSLFCWFGVVMSLFGVYLLVFYGGNAEIDFSNKDALIGNLLMIGACLAWVAYIEFTNSISKKYCALYVTWWQFIFGTIALVPFALFEGSTISNISFMSWGSILYLALVCSGFGYLVHLSSINKLGPVIAALSVNILPISATIGSVLLLGETVTLLQGIGGVIVLASIVAVTLGMNKKQQPIHTDTIFKLED